MLWIDVVGHSQIYQQKVPCFNAVLSKGIARNAILATTSLTPSLHTAQFCFCICNHSRNVGGEKASGFYKQLRV